MRYLSPKRPYTVNAHENANLMDSSGFQCVFDANVDDRQRVPLRTKKQKENPMFRLSRVLRQSDGERVLQGLSLVLQEFIHLNVRDGIITSTRLTAMREIIRGSRRTPSSPRCLTEFRAFCRKPPSSAALWLQDAVNSVQVHPQMTRRMLGFRPSLRRRLSLSTLSKSQPRSRPGNRLPNHGGSTEK